MIDFRILGSLEIWDRGRLIEVRRAKQRALLAILLLQPGEVLSTDNILDGLWGEAAPRTAKAALRNYVSQLRQLVGPDVLLSQHGGYLLDIAHEQIDLGRFQARVAEGRAVTGKERVAKLREALALWRGPPLEDLAFEPFASREIANLEELRTAALEDLIDAELVLGAGAELIGELESLIAKHPFRERIRGQLMLALYRAGRQAEALEAYQDTRRTLVDELGIEPSGPLRELERAILAQEPSLAAPAPLATSIGEPRKERRKIVTVLLADLTCAEDLDAELLRETTGRVLTHIRGVLEAHGAMIEQRAGEEVMGVFGVPLAHEDDPLRAARAAVELQAGVGALAEEFERKGHGRVELRVGIDTGEVLAGGDAAGHGFIAGTAITLAKRLERTAQMNEVLVGGATLALLGDAAVTEPVAEGRHRAFRLLEVVEGVPALPRHLEAPLIGRERELATLREAYASIVAERHCRLVLILGEAGIGKTRLVNELANGLEDAATVLVGRCVSYGRGATYLPLAEIIRQIEVRFELPELLASSEDANLIARKLAELTGEREGSGSGGEELWAFRRLLETLAAEGPLVLVFEDLHWAEPTLLDMIDDLVERAVGAPILVLGVGRLELLDERPEWSLYDSLKLRPLPSTACKALIDNLAEVQPELRSQIVRGAGGNPLFVEQLLAYASAEGELNPIPPSLEALLASRLDLLEQRELAVLQRAAVIGREFSRGGVVHLTPKGETEAVEACLLVLAQKGFVRARGAGEAFRFHHVLIRDAANKSIPRTLRSELHERAAEWLDFESPGQDELVGYHLEQAYRCRMAIGSPGESNRRLAGDAGRRLGAAGLRAAKSGDVHAAANLLARASSLLPKNDLTRHDVVTELGLVYWRQGELEDAAKTLRSALEIAVLERDRRAELRARLELANLRLFRTPEDGADEVLALAADAIPALEELGDERSLGRFWYVLAFVHGGLHCHYRESARAAERANGYFLRSGWPSAPCLQELAACLYYGPTSVPAGIRRCRTLVEKAERGGDAHVLAFLAGLESMAGRFSLARDLAARARAIYEELGWTVNISTNYASLAADIELLAGQFAEAEHILTESCTNLQAWGEQSRLATQATQLGEALYGLGRQENALHWSELAEGCAATDDASAQFSWRALRAKILAHRRAFHEAETLAREAVELAAATDAVSQHAHVLLSYAEVLSLEGRAPQARELSSEAIRLLEGKRNLAGSRQAHAQLSSLASA